MPRHKSQIEVLISDDGMILRKGDASIALTNAEIAKLKQAVIAAMLEQKSRLNNRPLARFDA